MNLCTNAESTWEWYGANDPYYGVIAHPRFRNSETRAEFFATGERYVEALLRTIRQHLDRDFAPSRLLDFGCGVGRVLIPLARISSSAVGVDISFGMRQEASKNCAEAGLKNVTLVSSVAEASGSYNFIHSSIVFQHMPVKVGLRTMTQLCQKLSNGGIVSIHFPIAQSKSYVRRVSYWIRCHIPGINPILTPVANMIHGRPARLPMMQMNLYPLNVVVTLIKPYCNVALLQIAPEGVYSCVNLIAQRSEQASELV
jgi:SAM-dependent methyltransferase